MSFSNTVARAARNVVLSGAYYPRARYTDPRLTYLWRPKGNQLFIVDDPVKSHELRKLAGERALQTLPVEAVEFRRRHDMFAEEIDLRSKRA